MSVSPKQEPGIWENQELQVTKGKMGVSYSPGDLGGLLECSNSNNMSVNSPLFAGQVVTELDETTQPTRWTWLV